MIIGLVGAPGAGKDDVVAHVLQYQYGFTRFAFADQIKKCYYYEIGITDEYFKSCRGTPEEEKIRKGLWEFSDKKRAEHGPMFFIDPMVNEMLRHKDAVVTDIRTEDELQKISEITNDIILVVRGDPQFLFDKSNELFPETRIPLNKLLNYSVFMNVSSSLEEARKDFNKYYREMMGGK
jgi:hypothetical protein